MYKNTTSKIYNSLKNLKLRLIVEGTLVGVLSGIIVLFYRILLSNAEDFAKIMYSFLRMNKTYIIWFIIIGLICSYIVFLLTKIEPMIGGSGIPQIEGILTGYFEASPFRIIINKFIGGVVCVACGLSLGREGPSIQLGATFGQAISKVLKRTKTEEKFLITSGASAGLAAAFNAPFAGVIFSLEEVHKNFSPYVLIASMSASVTADFISKQFLGVKPVFDVKIVEIIPFKFYGLLLLLGLFLGLLGIIYNKTTLKSAEIYKRLNIRPEFKMAIPFMFAILFGMFLPDVLCGGHFITEKLFNGEVFLKMAIILLIMKFIFSVISFGSGAPGGILFPLLVLGAISGAIFGNILNEFSIIDRSLLINFEVLAMAGMFTAIVRAPITGIMLICEMTGSFSNLLPLTLVCVVSYIVPEILGCKPIYEYLLSKQIERFSKLKKVEDCGKVIIRYIIHVGSKFEGKEIKSINMPHNSLILSIQRCGAEIIPKGDEKILAGDYILVLANKNEEDSIREEFIKLSEANIN